MLIGITGNFGSGKTTAAKMFKKLGACIIDADKIYHSLLKSGGQLHEDIVNAFGKGIIGADNRIKRDNLAKIIFKNKRNLKRLNKITHAKIIKEIKAVIKKLGKKKIIIVEAALLIESGFYKHMDKIVLIKASREQQIKRIMKKTSIQKQDILKRWRYQSTLEEKVSLADFIIDNNGSKNKTLCQVKNIWKKLGEDYANK